jgi:hypothetical protein
MKYYYRIATIFFLAVFLAGGWFLVKKDDSVVVIKKGEHFFQDGFTVENNKILLIEPGAYLKMGRDAKIIVKGKILAKGTKEDPIVFEGAGDYWRGIEIIGDDQAPNIDFYKKSFEENSLEKTDFFANLEGGNVFSYCNFRNLATNQKRDVSNRKKAVIEATNASVIITDSIFQDIVHIGAIQTSQSYLLARRNTLDAYLIMKVFHPLHSVYIIDENNIIPRRYEFQTWPDGLYGGYGVGIVTNNRWEGLSDDAIDFTASLGFVMGNVVDGTFDDGISLDNKSSGYVMDNKINNVFEHGLMVSNQSTAVLVNNEISKSENALLLRSGATAYAKNLILKDSQVGILQNSDIPLMLSEEKFKQIEQEILKSNIDRAKELAIYEKDSVEGMAEFFRNSYYDYAGYKILKNEINDTSEDFQLFDFLKKIMKLVDDKAGIMDFDVAVNNLAEEERERLLQYKNILYLSDSRIDGNAKSAIFQDPFAVLAKNVLVNKKENMTSQGSDARLSEKKAEEIFREAEEKKVYVKELLEKTGELESKLKRR